MRLIDRCCFALWWADAFPVMAKGLRLHHVSRAVAYRVFRLEYRLRLSVWQATSESQPSTQGGSHTRPAVYVVES